MIWLVLGFITSAALLIWSFLPKAQRGKAPAGNLLAQVQEGEEALKALAALPPRQRLKELLKHEKRFDGVFTVDDRIRQGIVATGISEAVRHFPRILKTPTGDGSLVRGIRDALKVGAEEDYRVQAFKFLVDGLDNGRYSIFASDIPELLMQLDEEWALRILRTPEYLNPEHALFSAVLDCLNTRGLELNLGEIEMRLANYQKEDLSHREIQEYIELLKALYFHDSARAEGLLMEASRERPKMAEEALETLLMIHDLPHPTFGLDDLQNKVGFDALSAAEKTVWLVNVYRYLMSREGLMLFHNDDRADRMCEMSDALREIGAVNHAAMVQAYMSLYGPEGPPANVAERMAFVKARGKPWDAAVGVICQRFDDTLEGLITRELRYEIEHRDQFRKRSEIRKLLEEDDKAAAG